MYTKTMLLQCAALFTAVLVYSSPAGVQAQEKDETLPTTSTPSGQCVGANEVESLRYHLYSELSDSKNEIETLRSDLQYWQNTTVSILKKYLLDSQGNGHYSNICEEDIKELREMISSLQGSQHQCAPNITEATDILRSMRGTLEEHRNIQTQELQEMIREISNGHLPLGTFLNPAPSCKVIPQNSPSGNYWIQSTGIRCASLKYCDMTRTCCDSTGGWMRVVNLNMTDPSQNCPAGFTTTTTTTTPTRTCGRPGHVGCNSVSFPLDKVSYSRVCGRVIAYQYNSPDAFNPFYGNSALTIDDGFFEGVSLTHGSNPRKHIWTFANAVDEIRNHPSVCPCTKNDFTGTVPPFVGNDYFCDTGSRHHYQDRLYSEDPLWDGAGCGGTSTCCEFNNPPWFCKQLPQPTTDDIELRMCFDEPLDNEDTKIELIELYVQ